ncbi:MAG: MMPL family transporter, partial [Liquorilactobacillus satsumensis]
MESILNCWGQWVFHNRIKVILAWLILFCALAAGVAKIGTNFNSDLKISGLAATDVQKVLKKDFKQDPNKASMRVVISGKAGILNNAHVQQAIINKVNSVAKNEKHIKNISNPYQMQAISKDFSTAYIDIAFDQSSNLVSTHNLQKIQNEFAELSSKQNLKINFAGSIASGSSQSNPYAETLGIIIAFILLMVLFRSFITAGMPIISAALGLISGLLLVMIGTNFFTIANVAQTLASMLGFAVGIDYGLFIINRYRLAISKKTPHQVALGATLASAGSSVFFAGITVIIAVLGLSLIKIDFLTQMGFAAAISVTFAVLSSLTLLPALIALLQKFVRPTKKQITQVTKSKSSLQEVVFKKPWLVGLVSA